MLSLAAVEWMLLLQMLTRMVLFAALPKSWYGVIDLMGNDEARHNRLSEALYLYVTEEGTNNGRRRGGNSKL